MGNLVKKKKIAYVDWAVMQEKPKTFVAQKLLRSLNLTSKKVVFLLSRQDSITQKIVCQY